MTKRETYVAEYFDDQYMREIADLREYYRSRMREAMHGSKEERMTSSDYEPNVATMVELRKDENGEIYIESAGDFVECFNQKYAGRDRIGDMVKALDRAETKAETCGESRPERHKAIAEYAQVGIGGKVRTAKRHFAFVHVMFAAMFLVSVVMFFSSGMILNRADDRIAALQEHERTVETVNAETLRQNEYLGYDAKDVVAFSMEGENSVEFYENAKGGMEMAALLNALLGGK